MTLVLNLRDYALTGVRSNVYVGRSNPLVARGIPGADGCFGNPYIRGRRCGRCGEVHADNASTLPCFEEHLRNRVARDKAFRDDVASLHGKTLYCWCAPRPCHADVLARVAAELNAGHTSPDCLRLGCHSAARHAPSCPNRTLSYPDRAHNDPRRTIAPGCIATRDARETSRTTHLSDASLPSYVIAGVAYVVHRVTRRAVTFRRVGSHNAFLVFDGAHRPDDRLWDVSHLAAAT